MDEQILDEPVLFDKKEIARTAQYLGIESDEPAQADIAFVFGGRYDAGAFIAADLFRRGVVRYVLVSGGRNRVTHLNEADENRAILLSEGVPADRIIVEKEANNTFANVNMALLKVREHLDIKNIKSVIVVTKWYHSRRVVMTLKQNWPHGIRYYTSTYEPEGVPRHDWHLHQSLTMRVLKELDVIPEYLEMGHIAEIELEDGAWV